MDKSKPRVFSTVHRMTSFKRHGHGGGGMDGLPDGFRQVQEELERLRESEFTYRSLVDNNPAAICLVSPEGRIVHANASCRDAVGYAADELIGMHYHDLLPPDYDKSIDDQFQSMIRGQISRANSYLRLVHKKGHIVDLGMKIVPVVRDEEVTGLFFVGRDVAEFRRAEELIIKSEKLAVVGQLAAGVAHEIRNPLTSLKGFIQLMRSTVDGKHEYFQIMLTELDRIESIIQEFLLFAKPQISDFRYVDPCHMLGQVIAIMQTQAMLNNVQIVNDVGSDMPAIWCDENHIKQVFMNLLKNSIEAMPTGGAIHVTSRSGPDGMVTFQVVDNGCGIPPERIPKLGEPFYTTKEKGTGLGLMVSHRIVEAHRGTLSIRSVVGKGTTVEISLPTDPPDDAESTEKAAP
ncbi:PAS domain S-box protein [Alicyclobacillus cycloheptanicus]|uniref:histidine kinase n=1 Tax=Alicyclobacillus cycloheptanicus TaxID=1457 RepID=A0ABT9XIH9_9BACL|nr:ATP-binding protein [Alicyclobacillus cycloheptanicus]MDQ0190093.1 PAS domain S-box-containing protein [Alicyclobacillus cycloheptanicus]WDM02068.1 PAS domain S-box protein [Alicyclobacillus cycloheptanicus]